MREFWPGWVPTLLVVLFLPILIGLGFWQLSRAEEKTTLLAQQQAQREAAPVALADLSPATESAYRRVRLAGRFDAEHDLLLDNRTQAGQVGVEVLQPFLDQASGLWVLVNRGWLPWPDRRNPVVFDTPQSALSLTAWVYVPLGAPFQLQGSPPTNAWPRLVTQVQPAELWKQLDRSGFPYELRLEPGPAAFRVDWPIVAMSPDKHLGYAVQWFALAAALCGLFIYLIWHTRMEKRTGVPL
ncbi:MAG: SURF1 family protein [Pseudomonadota bacterium]